MSASDPIAGAAPPVAAIIGGTGLDTLDSLTILQRETLTTPYGPPSGPLTYGQLAGQRVVFLARHGPDHTVPPHRINYRANLWALRRTGARRVIAVAAVGGIRADLGPGVLAFPDQLIDYTWGRVGTFFDGAPDPVVHSDFTEPYSRDLRRRLIQAARDLGLAAVESGVYAAMSGPRLETAAEVGKLERDGCAMVGMTGMPEAILARELELEYAVCAVVANWAAGKTPGVITMAEIERNLHCGMAQVRRLLTAAIPVLAAGEDRLAES